jgi:hypothetical protein
MKKYYQIASIETTRIVPVWPATYYNTRWYPPIVCCHFLLSVPNELALKSDEYENNNSPGNYCLRKCYTVLLSHNVTNNNSHLRKQCTILLSHNVKNNIRLEILIWENRVQYTMTLLLYNVKNKKILGNDLRKYHTLLLSHNVKQ